jgi:peptidylprolyl isomerase
MSGRVRSLVIVAALFSATAPTLAAQEGEKPAAAPEPPAVPEITKEVVTTGEGELCGAGRIAAVHYTGTFKDGKKFDSSRDRDDPFVFEVGSKGVIDGWDETVAKMRVGDRWKVTIPWQKAYGAAGSREIPAKADLVFDIELLGYVEPKVEVLNEGKGEKPELREYVLAHYTLSIVGGEQLTDTRKGDPVPLQVGAPTQIRGLDFMLKRMRIGDRWKITIPPSLAFGKRGVPPRIPANAEILVDFEVVQKLGVDIEVLKEGAGPHPQPGQKVKVHYTGTFTDGAKFDSSRDKGTPFSFLLGAGQVIPGWDMTLAKMRVGERVKVTIPWHFAYGAQGRPPLIPAKADLVFDIELLAIE